MINKNKLKKIITEPMGDDDIKYYLPNAKIKTYKDLSKYNDLDELLVNDNDYVIILYPVNSINNGHWIAVLKYDFNDEPVYEYFDPYGKYPDEPLTWLKGNQSKEFKVYRSYLSDLFDKCNRKVIYNPTDWQYDHNHVNSCGRWSCWRVICQFKYNKNLQQFYNFMKKLKKDMRLPYDEIVSYMIDK